MAGDGRVISQRDAEALRRHLWDAIRNGDGVSLGGGALMMIVPAVLGFEFFAGPSTMVIALSIGPLGFAIAALFAARVWQIRGRLRRVMRDGELVATQVVDVKHDHWGGKPSIAVRLAVGDETERQFELRMADRSGARLPAWAEVGASVRVRVIDGEGYAIARAAGAAGSDDDRLVRRWEQVFVCGMAARLWQPTLPRARAVTARSSRPTSDRP